MATLHEQYAAALETLVEKTDVTSAVQKLQSLLAAKGRLALMPKIAVALKKQAQRKQSQNQLVLFVARQSDADVAQKEAGLDSIAAQVTRSSGLGEYAAKNVALAPADQVTP